MPRLTCVQTAEPAYWDVNTCVRDFRGKRTYLSRTGSATFIYFLFSRVEIRLALCTLLRKITGEKKKEKLAVLLTSSSTRLSTKNKVGHPKRSSVARRVHLDTPTHICLVEDALFSPYMTWIMHLAWLHVWQVPMSGTCRGGYKKQNKTGFEPLCKPSWVNSNPDAFLGTCHSEWLVSCQLCYRVMRKVPVFCPSAVALCHHIIINPL